jgi:predicted DNA-binding ArsR family transcriptional regulator
VKTTHPIEWHEQCAKNQFANLLIDLQRLKTQIDLAIKSVEGFQHYVEQIQAAKAKGKKSFDSGRFMVKK